MRSRTILLVLASVVALAATAGVAIWIRRSGQPEGETVAGLVERLREGAATARREAATALGQVEGPGVSASARGLVAALDDRDAEVRARAARSLGGLLGANPLTTLVDDAARVLGAALGDKDARVRASSAIALRGLGRDPPRSLDALYDGLRGDDPTLRHASAAAFASRPITGGDDLRRLLDGLDDEDEAVRRAARAALSRPHRDLTASMALPVLGATIRSGSPAAREITATALGRSLGRVPAARDLLLAVLARDADPSVRVAAAAALGAFSEDPAARAALRAATDDPDLRVRATVSASLAVGRRSARAEAIAGLRTALAGDVSRADLADAVASDPARAAARLVTALRDPSPLVRAAAAIALGEVADRSPDPRAAIDSLSLALGDADPSVRRAAASALSRFGAAARPAADALKRALLDADRGVSAAALVTLQGIDRTVRVR
jgi:HEAT repeat protein